MTKADEAMKAHEQGCNCAESITVAFAPHYGIDKTAALHIAGGFGGGMGRLTEVCGAVTGAFMILGLQYPRAGFDDRDGKERIYAKVREFAESFRSKHGSIICREILGVDIGTPEGSKEAADRQLVKTVCSECIRSAAVILEEMIA